MKICCVQLNSLWSAWPAGPNLTCHRRPAAQKMPYENLLRTTEIPMKICCVPLKSLWSAWPAGPNLTCHRRPAAQQIPYENLLRTILGEKR